MVAESALFCWLIIEVKIYFFKLQLQAKLHKWRSSFVSYWWSQASVEVIYSILIRVCKMQRSFVKAVFKKSMIFSLILKIKISCQSAEKKNNHYIYTARSHSKVFFTHSFFTFISENFFKHTKMTAYGHTS